MEGLKEPRSAAETEHLGAVPAPDGTCRFRVWAPRSERVVVRLLGDRPRVVDMAPADRGYHEAVVEDVPVGTRYLYRLENGTERPDPASRSQPEGVHGPSAVVDSEFDWTDSGWTNPPLDRYVVYELHVGAFTPQGTFDAMIPRLADLADLGVTAIELMPVAQFPGDRNWGYDGVGLFAAQSSYGGATALRRFVNAAHDHGLAVLLDVVYNHLGPEGNYLAEFGPYFTDRYRTPWGPALNFDGPHSDEVRAFFIENALYWVRDCRFDGLRLDAVHAILDTSALPFLEELTAAVHEAAEQQQRRIHVIAESADNDSRLVRPAGAGGIGLDGQWNDDFHHALHALLTAEREGYYADYGELEHLARGLREGYVYSGQYSVYYRRRQGRPSADVPPHRFTVFAQNHDQTGNRAFGERIGELAGADRARLAAAVVLLSPYVPLLFMGEEYGDPAPFLYFTSHGDPELADAVRKGRRREFAAFGWRKEPPDPQSPDTFRRSRLDWSLRESGEHAALLEFHRQLLRLRREVPALAALQRDGLAVETAGERVLVVQRRRGDSRVTAIFNFADGEAAVDLPAGCGWRRLIDSAETRFGGPGAASPETVARGGPTAVRVAPRSAAAFASE